MNENENAASNQRRTATPVATVLAYVTFGVSLLGGAFALWTWLHGAEKGEAPMTYGMRLLGALVAANLVAVLSYVIFRAAQAIELAQNR